MELGDVWAQKGTQAVMMEDTCRVQVDSFPPPAWKGGGA